MCVCVCVCVCVLEREIVCPIMCDLGTSTIRQPRPDVLLRRGGGEDTEEF